MKNSNKNFCVNPFTHLNIKQEGRVSACWRYQGAIGDYRYETLEEIWNGEKLKKLRKDLLHGEQPYECRSCWDYESNNLPSPRTSSNEIEGKKGYTEDYLMTLMDENYNMPIAAFKKIELRFDNICNLMCRHCSPMYSSKWHSEVTKNPAFKSAMEEHTPMRVENHHVRLTDDLINETIKMCGNLDHIMIAGGEPLVHPKHYDFLYNILPEASHIHLDYNSNLGTLTFKGKSIVDLWKQFKSIQLRVSMDGYPGNYEYVRVHSNLNDVVDNVHILHRELPDAKIQTTCTTSVLNITRIVEIFEFFTEIGGFAHTSLVQTPIALNPKILPPKLKDETSEKWNIWIANLKDRISELSPNHWQEKHVDFQVKSILSYGQNVIDYMNSENKFDEWNKFKAYITAQDKLHNTNVLDVYPEFKEYW